MKLLLSKREQRVLAAAGALALVIGWVYAAYIIGPLKREADKLGREVKASRQPPAPVTGRSGRRPCAPPGCSGRPAPRRG